MSDIKVPVELIAYVKDRLDTFWEQDTEDRLKRDIENLKGSVEGFQKRLAVRERELELYLSRQQRFSEFLKAVGEEVPEPKTQPA